MTFSFEKKDHTVSSMVPSNRKKYRLVNVTSELRCLWENVLRCLPPFKKHIVATAEMCGQKKNWQAEQPKKKRSLALVCGLLVITVA